MIGDYDVAVSFAGAQRAYVEKVVRACERLGLRVFYDRDHTVDFWGRNVIYGLRTVYGGARARYVVAFLSSEYLAGSYPMDEFDAAVVRAIERREDGYILPVVLGAVDIPAHLLSPVVGYLRAEDHTVDELARMIANRVRTAEPRNLDTGGG